MKTITARELQDRISDVSLLDVRTPVEFEEVHIPNSRLLPLHELSDAKAAEIAGRSGAQVVVCKSGNRARQAAEKLLAVGSSGEFLVLEGGVTAWESAGGAVQRGRKTMSIERQVRIGAGTLVVTGVVLGAVVNPWFVALSAFVGCGLIFAGITDWCGMGLLLARMPWNNRRAACSRPEGAQQGLAR